MEKKKTIEFQNQFFNQSEFKKYSNEMVDMICDLKQELLSKKLTVRPKIQPGDVRKLLPNTAPQEP